MIEGNVIGMFRYRELIDGFVRRLCHVMVAIMVAAACVALVVIPSASIARADEGESPAIGWTQLGLPGRVEMLGSNEPTDVSMPVPQGVSPTILAGTIGPVVNATGRVDVLDRRGVVLGSIGVPLDSPAAPFVVDVSAAEVLDGVAKLSFVIRDADAAATDRCRQPPSVSLTQLATTYSGPTPSPQTVADFLPGYLDRVVIWVGQNPNRDRQQAALSLVADLTRLYRPMPVRIDVDTSEALQAGASAGSQRAIAIVDGDQPGLTVVNPNSPDAVLDVVGKGPDLQRQVALFTDRRFGLAQTPSAEVTSAERGSISSTDTLSFADLGIYAETSVLGVNTVFAGFDAASFGVGPIDGARVHLIAKYTPVTNADASVLVRSGSAVLASAVLNDSGVVDLTADVPGAQLGSNVDLALEVRYIPRRDCAAVFDRMTFAVDPQSTVTVNPGTDSRGGFASMPMSFTPDFDVALDNADQIRLAAQAINLMGQQTSVALRPNLTTLDEAVSRRSGLLVAASGAELTRKGMRPPLQMTSATAVDVNGDPVTGVDLNGPLGVVEAFPTGGRMVVAIDTSGDATLLERNFDYIRGLNGRWGALTGDALATGAAGTTVELAEGLGASTSPSTPPSQGWQRWIKPGAAIGAVGVVALLAVITALILRRRRKRRVSE